MRLPSKVTPFKDSTLSLLPLLLKEINKGDISPLALLEKVRDKVGGISNFTEALDCLCALNKIKLNEQTEFLSHVN